MVRLTLVPNREENSIARKACRTSIHHRTARRLSRPSYPVRDCVIVGRAASFRKEPVWLDKIGDEGMDLSITLLYSDEICLIGLELLILWSLNARTGWVKNRSTRRRVLLVCTSTLLVIQAGLAYDLLSYYQGEIGYEGPMMGFPVYGNHFNILPGESCKIGRLSNWFTAGNLYVRIRSSDNNVTFFVTDENIPQIRHEEGNYSDCELLFVLPYRFSRPFVVANWTVNLYNPSQNESIFVSVSMFSDPMEDVGIIAMHTVIFSHEWPLIAVLTLWFYTDVSIQLEKSRRPASHVQAREQPHDVRSSTAEENPEKT